MDLKLLASCATSLVISCAVHAAQPLITEDTGTQGRGRSQIELSSEYGRDRVAETRERTVWTNLVYSYGLIDTLDVIATLPHERRRTDDGASVVTRSGLTDVGLDLKWRFYEEGVLSFALKPGVTFPTGDETKNLGAGKHNYSLYFVTTLAPEPWAFHLHLGKIHHPNRINEREDIWHASFAGSRRFGDLQVVLDLGADSNTDPTTRVKPAFAIIGLIYALGPDLDLDFGFKKGISDPEVDRTWLIGVTARF